MASVILGLFLDAEVNLFRLLFACDKESCVHSGFRYFRLCIFQNKTNSVNCQFIHRYHDDYTAHTCYNRRALH